MSDLGSFSDCGLKLEITEYLDRRTETKDISTLEHIGLDLQRRQTSFSDRLTQREEQTA